MKASLTLIMKKNKKIYTNIIVNLVNFKQVFNVIAPKNRMIRHVPVFSPFRSGSVQFGSAPVLFLSQKRVFGNKCILGLTCFISILAPLGINEFYFKKQSFIPKGARTG